MNGQFESAREQTENLLLLRGDGCVAGDEHGEDAAESLNAERKGRDVEEKNVLDVSPQNAALDGSPHGHNLIRIHTWGSRVRPLRFQFMCEYVRFECVI